jgi:hypothetical protein
MMNFDSKTEESGYGATKLAQFHLLFFREDMLAKCHEWKIVNQG